MKQILSFLLMLLFESCQAQSARTDVDAALSSGVDPYFIESTDTVSVYGPDHITRDVLQDRHGDIWFATWLGIIKYDGKLFTNYTLKAGLIHFHVLSIFEDKKGNLWFGTARGGVYRYNGSSFTLFTTKDGLTDNTVTSFAEDQKGNIWMATENGASRYNGKTFTHFTTTDGLRSNNVSAVIRDKAGKIWLGCRPTTYMLEDGGVCCYDEVSGRFTAFINNDGTPFKNVTSLFEDKAGNIWIGKFDGLTVYNGKVYSDVLSDYLTYYFTEDKSGNVWFSHSEPNIVNPNLPNQVLYRYVPSSEQQSDSLSVNENNFTRVLEKNQPNDFQIFGKTADDAGNIWFGTMHGPCRYDGKTFTYFTK